MVMSHTTWVLGTELLHKSTAWLTHLATFPAPYKKILNQIGKSLDVLINKGLFFENVWVFQLSLHFMLEETS